MVNGMLPPPDNQMGQLPRTPPPMPQQGQGAPPPMPQQGQGAPPISQGVAPQEPGAAPPVQQRRPQRDYRKQPLGEADKRALEMFQISAVKLIHSPGTQKSILSRIGISDKGPIDDIADLAVVVVDRIDKQFQKDTGAHVDNAVKIQGANTVVGHLIEVAETSGKLPKFSEDERAVAYTYAVQKYVDRMIARGETTRGELMKHVKDAQKVSESLQDEGVDMTGAPTTAPEIASQVNAPENPMKPTQTMSQKLAKEGILDG